MAAALFLSSLRLRRLDLAGRIEVALPLARSHTPGGESVAAATIGAGASAPGSGYETSIPSNVLKTVWVGLIEMT